MSNFIETISKRYHFTFQEQQILKTIQTDLNQWGEKSLEEIWDCSLEQKYEGKKLKKELLAYVKNYYDSLRKKPTDYKNFDIEVKPQK